MTEHSSRDSEHSFTPMDIKGAGEHMVAPEISAVLAAHVVDILPEGSGSRELRADIGDVAVGAKEVRIDRPHPSLQVPALTLGRGKSMVMFGENGAGKSTIFAAIMDRDAHFATQEGAGALVYGSSIHERPYLRIARLDQEELLDGIGHIPAGDALAQIAEHYKLELPVDWFDQDAHERNLKNQEAHIRIETLMNQIAEAFEMKEFFRTPIAQLSGGERTKMALFMTMLGEPDVLLLDEPTNHLDLKSIALLRELFDQYKNADASIVSVSHVDWFLRDVGKDGVIEVTRTPQARIVTQSNGTYANFVKNAERSQDSIMKGEVSWDEYYMYKRGEVVILAPPQINVPESPLKGVEGLPSIYGGDLVIINGDNGSGKTKLMETITAAPDGLRPEKGVQVAYLPQFWPEEITGGSIGDFFAWIKQQAAPHARGSVYHPEQPAEKHFLRLIGDLSFAGQGRVGEGWLQQPFGKLSGGEQRGLWFVAVSTLPGVDVLVLDEPTNHMDVNSQAKITKAIQSFPGAVVLATHDRVLMSNLANENDLLGSGTTLRHIVLTKQDGFTSAELRSDNPAEYMQGVVVKAQQRAKQIKFDR